MRSFVSRALAAGLACMALAPSAWADPQVLQSARRNLSEGNPKQAYMDLIALQAQLAGDVEFDYLLGVAALDSGKTDDAIVAFERVLALNAGHAGAQLDLARAYFTSGAFDLAEAAFQDLKRTDPPPLALQTIDRYLAALAKRKKALRPGFSGYAEVSAGYDDNITGVPADFSSAILSSFNLPGVEPTGNAVKRAAAFAATAAGLDYFHPLARGWSLYAGGDVYGRAYRDQSDFNAKGFDARTGGALNDGPQQWRVGATAGRFYQDGQAPGEPKPTNDRRFAGVNGEWRLAVNQRNQVGLSAQVSRQRFPDNEVEDFDEVLLSASWLRSFDAGGLPTLYLTGFLAADEAVRKLPDGVADKSKRVGGVRAHVQVALNPALQLFGGLGYTARNDRSAYARSTQVEFGRDRLADASLGVSWRLRPRCTLRAQWLYSRNDSNIALYDYSRNEISTAVRWEFE